LISPKKIAEHLKTLLSDFRKKKFLLATSGGADSMVLMNLFHTLNLKFQAAHVNYKLRGEDSENDQKLVTEFCKKNNIKVHFYEVSKDEKPKNSIQIWARNLRYDFFKNILEKENLDVLATAHHLNDELETFLINLSRGSGIRGLSGIPENENRILRPLLNFTKKEIYDFAKLHNIKFREDISNQKNDYLRNKIRNEIIPKLEETTPDFLKNFKKSLNLLSQTKDFTNEKTDEIFRKISKKKNRTFFINKEKFSKESDFVKYEILRKFGFCSPTEIPKIFVAKTGSLFYSENFVLNVDRTFIIIAEKEKTQDEEIIISESFDHAKNIIDLNLSEFIKLETKNHKKEIWKYDLDKLTFPLKLRPKKEGDTFFPTGMKGKKKVSKFFKDEKLSVLAKQKTWILCTGNDEILGIVPHRQDRKFSANTETEKVLRIIS
jgi:tRNA(Ile)-lysidine synthase